MKIQKSWEDRKLNQARSKPHPIDLPVRTTHTTMHHNNGTQYHYNTTETVL